MKYSQTLIDDEYESSNIASQNELKIFVVILILITLRRTSLLLTQKIKEYNRNNRLCHGNKIRIMGKNYEHFWKE